MASFAAFVTPDDHVIKVNKDQVLYVMLAATDVGECALLYLDKDHYIVVKGSVDDVTMKLM